MTLSRADAEAIRDAIQDLLFFTSHPPKSAEEDSIVGFAWQTIERLTTNPIAIPGEDSQRWTHDFREAAWKVHCFAKAPTNERPIQALQLIRECQDTLRVIVTADERDVDAKGALDVFQRIRDAQPNPVELDDAELAQVEAWVNTRPRRPVSLARLQQEKRAGITTHQAEPDAEENWLAHLRFVVEYNRNLRGASQPGGTVPPRSGTEAKLKRAGRKPDTDPEEDKRIAEAWASGCYRNYADLDRERGLKPGDGKRAVDRHRKRNRPLE